MVTWESIRVRTFIILYVGRCLGYPSIANTDKPMIVGHFIYIIHRLGFMVYAFKFQTVI